MHGHNASAFSGNRSRHASCPHVDGAHRGLSSISAASCVSGALRRMIFRHEPVVVRKERLHGNRMHDSSQPIAECCTRQSRNAAVRWLVSSATSFSDSGAGCPASRFAPWHGRFGASSGRT